MTKKYKSTDGSLYQFFGSSAASSQSKQQPNYNSGTSSTDTGFRTAHTSKPSGFTGTSNTMSLDAFGLRMTNSTKPDQSDASSNHLGEQNTSQAQVTRPIFNASSSNLQNSAQPISLDSDDDDAGEVRHAEVPLPASAYHGQPSSDDAGVRH